MERPDGRQILLEASGGLQSAGGEEPRGVSGELVAGDGEPVDVVEPAESLESLVLGGEGLLRGGGPGRHHEPLHFPVEVILRTLNKIMF